jgi:hypothetical protein
VRIPWVVYASAAAELLPLVAALLLWRHLSSSLKWIAGWSGLLVAGEVTTLGLALQGVNNHWVNYVGTPIAAGLVLWALAHWYPSSGGQRAVRMLIPIMMVFWIAMIALVEEIRTFSVIAEPILGLVLFASALSTLIARSLREEGRLRDQSWWWVSLGLLVSFGTTVAFAPAAYILLQEAPHLLIRAYEIRAGLTIVAFLLITRGMLCGPARSPALGY